MPKLLHTSRLVRPGVANLSSTRID